MVEAFAIRRRARITLALACAALLIAASGCAPSPSSRHDSGAAASVDAARGAGGSPAGAAAAGQPHTAAAGQPHAAAPGLPCLKSWGKRQPFLAHLDVWIYGQKVPVPAAVGFDERHGCTYPVSTMDGTGILHVMALPNELDMSGPYVGFNFTLGQFLAEAGATANLPSGPSELLGRPLTEPGTAVTGWVNGILWAVGWDQVSALKIPAGGELTVIIGPPWGFNAPFAYSFPAQHGVGQGGG
ncbi:MAG: hypothetical protein QJR08_00350 [Bacillota bacterium]|nr:hypothetical protein [Bacillota bacterium]